MWKDFFLGRAYFSNSLDFKLPTLLKLSQTRGRFMFQLKDQRDLSNKHIIPPPKYHIFDEIWNKHIISQKYDVFSFCCFLQRKKTVDFCKTNFCRKIWGRKYEPFGKNTSKTALLANTNSCKMFRCYLQGNSLYFCSYTGAGKLQRKDNKH